MRTIFRNKRSGRSGDIRCTISDYGRADCNLTFRDLKLEIPARILNISAEVSPVQAIAEQSSGSPNVIVFPASMGKRKPKPDPAPDPKPQGGYNPSRYGNFAQWFSAVVSAIAISLTLYFH